MLRKIDFSQKHFECGGRKFYLRDSLSFNRYRELQKLMIEFGYSATFADIFKNLRKAWDSLNELKLAESSVVIHNIMNGISKMEQKEDVSLRICALFIDEEGEDPTIYDEAKMKDKIDCWGGECDISPFFHLAASLVPDWYPAYRLVINSPAAEEKEQHILIKT